ncbi:hypothetical protein OR263_31895 [Streptomyces sp. NEAU-H22]|uniref:hypothetical protein n=1 Tax=unclassified Streptomyces TaxID=2593676 RepID=UPI00224D860D|nr:MULTISPECIES: hypothetical protein [unclassified Streptomyces]MCX3291259.1 hypothetical protein [Streptomyces sp. NEAU-H22]WMD03267.1 hypothetical protein Q7C01_02225 [Streptomyces sp. FXY-T5]
MPRGRHRHSPPLHRMLPPSAIAGVSLVCALGPWVFTEPTVLRGLAAAAAATAVIGAVVLRRWDTQAGKRVADLTRARASDEWRFEERVAELEADLEESRELRGKLEQRLRAKRTELAGLRNEHAALLRRYATSETERASVLEERRVLEIEATAPVRAALPAGTPDPADAAPEPDEAAAALAVEEGPEVPAVFSPEGSRLFVRAAAALARFDGGTVPVPDPDGGGDGDGGPKGEDKEPAQEPKQDRAEPREQAREDEAEAREQSEAADGHERATAESGGERSAPAAETAESGVETAESAVESPASTAGAPESGVETPASGVETAESAAGSRESAAEASVRPGGTGRLPEAARVEETDRPEQSGGRLSGHYTVPTAVAVPPQSPVRRPSAGGGFDFFGTKAGTSRAALEAVQNEDLADVVGQEALALHKAETEARYKPVDEESRGIGQVIDLTAHDETEQIDVQGLRSAVS